MANVVENLGWVDGVYQIETTDPVEGGPDGIANLQIKQLASRTKYLYDLVNAVLAPFMGNDGYESTTKGKGWVLFNDIVTNIPLGWAEVVEMRGKSAFGGGGAAPLNTVGNTGGNAKITLTTSNIPPLTVTIPRSEADTGEVGATKVLVNNSQDAGTFTLEAKNNNVGGVASEVDILNPYRVVTYIKWVGLP